MAETRSSFPLLTYLRVRRRALLYGLALAALTTLPYALAWQAVGEHWRFSGFLIGVEDGNSYIAKMLLGSQGLWLFRPPYTTWQVTPLPLFLPYIVLGKLAGGAARHLQLTILYHLARAVAVVLVVLATFDFVSLFLESPRARWWATVLATVGGGLGFWGMALGVRFGWGGALCCYSPEAFGFLESALLFHNTLAHALLLWLLVTLLAPRATPGAFQKSCIWLLQRRRSLLTPARKAQNALFGHPLPSLSKGGKGESRRQAAGGWVRSASERRNAGTLAIIEKPSAAPKGLPSALVVALAATQPLMLVVAALTMGLLAALSLMARLSGRKGERLSADYWAALVITLVLGLGYAWLARHHVYSRIWAQQSIVAPESLAAYLWAYAWLWPLALVGAWAQRHTTRHLWVGVWGLVFPLFAWLPVTNSRRLVEGGWTALAVLTVWGLQRLPSRPRRWAAGGILALALVPALALGASLLHTARHPRPPVFLPADQAAAFTRLAALARDGDGVLAAYPTGNALPAWAPVRVIAGLGAESPFVEQQKRAIARFFAAATDDAWRQRFLARNRLRWVFWGPEEQALGNWNPTEAAYLCLRYRSEAYAFFEVCR